nr:MAG: replication initiator protein [Microvirus sp.]
MCVSPITINKGTPDAKTFGCGKCMPCHQKYVNQWSFRFRIHANNNPIFHCVTLTYNNQHLPYVKSKNNQKMYKTLVKSHAQTFFKTLRNKHTKRQKGGPKTKISYMICGEYGDQFKRPHYHSIIFGAHPEDIITSWRYGTPHFGDSDLEKTLAYGLKYTLKSKQWKQDKNYLTTRPFINFSKNIGLDLLCDPITGEVNLLDLPDTITMNDNKQIIMPRYYQDKIGRSIDTSELKEKSIQKHRDFTELLNSQNVSFPEYAKDYYDYILHRDRKNKYDNEIITDAPFEFIRPYSYIHSVIKKPKIKNSPIINKKHLEISKTLKFHDLEPSQ